MCIGELRRARNELRGKRVVVVLNLNCPGQVRLQAVIAAPLPSSQARVYDQSRDEVESSDSDARCSSQPLAINR